jgi:multidrug efflux pump
VVLVALVIFCVLAHAARLRHSHRHHPGQPVVGVCMMALAGFNVNTLTLLALVLAIGLVVDDAIIMLETSTATSEGMDPFSAHQGGQRRSGFISDPP